MSAAKSLDQDVVCQVEEIKCALLRGKKLKKNERCKQKLGNRKMSSFRIKIRLEQGVVSQEDAIVSEMKGVLNELQDQNRPHKMPYRNIVITTNEVGMLAMSKAQKNISLHLKFFYLILIIFKD